MEDALAAVAGLLAEPLSRHPRMSASEAALVQLVITFLRNLAAVPDVPAYSLAGAASGDAARRVRTGLLERLMADNVLDLLLLLAQHAREVGVGREGGAAGGVRACRVSCVRLWGW